MTKKIRGSGTKKPIINGDSKIYLKEIKIAFKDEKHKYHEFLMIMKDFQRRRIDIQSVMAKVKKLLKCHEELLLKFNNFLPDGLEIKPPIKKPKMPEVNKEKAEKYLCKVKTRFRRQPHVYDLFLEILSMYKNKDKSLEELYEMVTSLFKDHSDLVNGFIDFLP
ncbi:paired amphipathic helix protein Sin3-like 5 isoform X5 [Lathyrus oleraceus]|uniref:paired amphipathic helix protein Sin3-like 5 isoform X1 n=1 Tax=Pisum sativum TaxID=3888 RepID=UPI0021D09669|nr:paired amphipathic helix protein Sin3-like 5 isoform X1 [Pisum sativum]XP_050907860.1 paired amphipathic helix protein Sin3-like 5 isoform X2 [Pisum sativum]XP_050907861.1 paired amphipathic helix protein Sin3-like 5 isoform X3 [Pisum sativum]XP_050907862.1 paired amphipathic helix protein Sin3-like 5 isoform X4 [Pisum sativum]XP_050907863.1 paired amphipathic helix protein Sin3-like 5 isoform X5 [Pisum sativum]